MENTEQILNEIKELKSLIAKLIGVSDASSEKPFSIEAIDKATKEFKKLSIERGEWIGSDEIDKYIKSASYRSGDFIRKEFEFTNCFKRGSSYYYYKKDIISLGKILKERQVDLGRYIELKEDQLKFEKYIQSIVQNDNGKSKKPYRLPSYLKNIMTSPPKMPSVEVLKAEMKKLKEEFFQEKLTEYIDIYKGNYALVKNIYYYQRYIDPNIRKRIFKWTEEFNLVNGLLKEITKKKEIFIPVPEEEIIRL